MPDSHSAPHQPHGGPYRHEGDEAVQPGLMPDHGSSPLQRPPHEQMPPGGWDQPLVPAPGSERADWGSRAAATAIDFVLWLMVSLLAAVVLGVAFGLGALASDDSSLLSAGGVAIALASFGIYALYTGRLMTRAGRRNGQTLGKQLLGIRVVRVDGAPVTLATVALRHWLLKYLVFGILAAATLYLATLVNYLRPLFDAQDRTLHDQAARTRVVRA